MGEMRRVIDGFEVCREENDLFVYRFPNGIVKAKHLHELIGFEKNAWGDGLPTVHILALLGKDLSISTGTLPATAQYVKDSPPRATAFVVHNFVHRVAMDFLVRAVRGLGVKLDAKIFTDEALARAWLIRRREGRASRSSIQPSAVERISAH